MPEPGTVYVRRRGSHPTVVSEDEPACAEDEPLDEVDGDSVVPPALMGSLVLLLLLLVRQSALQSEVS